MAFPGTQPELVGGGGLGRGDADEASTTASVFEFDVTGDESEERVVLALADVFAGLVLGAALANQDRSCVESGGMQHTPISPP